MNRKDAAYWGAQAALKKKKERDRSKPSHCEGCGEVPPSLRYRGQWICDSCLLIDGDPDYEENQRHAAFTKGQSATSYAAEMHGGMQRYGAGDLKEALDRAIKKHGIKTTESAYTVFSGLTTDQYKNIKEQRAAQRAEKTQGRGI